jgi:hypothetical protein
MGRSACVIAALDVTPGEVACMVQAAHDAHIQARMLAKLTGRGSARYAELRHAAARFATLERSLFRLQAEIALSPGLVLQVTVG